MKRSNLVGLSESVNVPSPLIEIQWQIIKMNLIKGIFVD
jgi:hypothetical protein